ncbi:MAG TPA: copper transporter [Solirubrobacterales bacterium]|nr:copper transporter [Solirubrobacterales bacterium]
MGYSARYHASSLIAVFLALAIGILIGAEFGGDALTSTRKDLERSLADSVQDARERAEELNSELADSNEFADRVYPVLVRDRLAGQRIAVVALGELPNGVTDAVEEALAPTGGRLVGIGVVREPVDLAGLAEDLSQTRFADLRESEDTQTELGTGLGRQLVVGGTLLEAARGHLFSRASGNFGGIDAVIVVRNPPQDMGPVQQANAGRLESALMQGMTATRAPVVGVETSGADPSSISFFTGNDLASVDSVDASAGKVALVFALLGAEGSFGVKSSADRLLPDILAPAEPELGEGTAAEPAG